MRAGAALLAGLLSTTGSAQPGDLQVTELDFFAELPVVLHATRLSQPVADTPASITILDQTLIRASTASTIPELLRYVAGFQVAYPSGSEATATYHGAADQHSRSMQVLIDGRSVYNQIFGGIRWDLLALTIEDIDRIEVIRGPNAAAYGANAFFGVINIVTKEPMKFPGTSVRADAGSRETLRTHARHAGGSGAIDYSLSAYYEQGDGFDSQNDDFHAAHVNLQGSFRLNVTDALEFGLSFRDADAGLGFPEELDGLFLRDRAADSNHQLLRWRRIDAVDSGTQVTLYRNDERSRESLFPFELWEYLSLALNRFVPPPEAERLTGIPNQTIGVDFTYNVQRYDLELERTQRLDDTLRVVGGAGYREDRASARGLLEGGSASRSQWRVFAHGEWEPDPGWLINLGGMYEEHEDIGGYFSPRLGVNYRIDPRRSLRLVGSRAYRIPTLFESYASIPLLTVDREPVDLIDEPGRLDRYESLGPRPERIDALELGFFGQFVDDRLSTDLKLFHEDIDDLVGTARLERETRPETEFIFNRSTLRRRGFETQLRYQGDRDFVSVGYSLVDTAEDGERPPSRRRKVSGNTLSALYARQLSDSLQASVSAFYFDEMRWRGEGSTVPETYWVDIKLEKTLRLNPGEARLAFSVHNLFDRDNVTFRPENRDERQYLATFRYEY